MSVEAILRPIDLTLRRAQFDKDGRNDRVGVAACHISKGSCGRLFGGGP
jgi:hypothetical protein